MARGGENVVTERAGSVERELRFLFEGGTLAELTDGQLLERFQTGSGPCSEQAFAALVGRHGRMVLRTCQRVLRNEHDAHDAFQAAFLILLTKGCSLRVRDSLGPWLHRVAARAALRARVLRTRRNAAERDLAGSIASPAPQDLRCELLAVLHEELDRLPEKYRAAIILCDLEGLTCDEAARRLGCPIGTVGSRLARGRERLRGRLARRGFAPAGPAVLGLLSLDALGAAVPSGLAVATVELALWHAGRGARPAIPAGAAEIVRYVTRSVSVEHVKLAAIAFTAAAALCLIPALSYRAMALSQPQARTKPLASPDQSAKPGAGRQEPPAIELGGRQAVKDVDPTNDPIRHQGFLLAEIGNMKPLIHTKHGVSFTSREAVLYSDGSAKLWSLDRPEPVCPTLRHTDPIRELSFFDGSGLLVTTSDSAVKVWNGATGELRKELPGQFLRPLFFLHDKSGASRFVTVDSAGRVVTTWDAKTLEKVDSWEVKGSERLMGAGLSPDGAILATIAEDHTVTLRQADTKQEFARLRPPSRQLGSVFVNDEVKALRRPVLQLHPHFWTVVKDLAPSGSEPKQHKPAKRRVEAQGPAGP
jgi:RNA polymerase sigma factor (sigma-70 family)